MTHVNLPTLYPEQHAAFFNDARYSICEASTKAGKTLGAVVWLMYELLHDTRPLNWWWIAPVHPQAEIGYTRTKHMFKGVWERHNDTDKWLLFPGSKKLWFKSGEKPDNLYGEDVAAAVIDEFTRLREQAWWAIRSTLTATNGPIRMIGNVKGRGNWGYRIARKAEQGAPNYSYHKITAEHAVANGAYSQAELDDARESLPEHVFRELYYCEPSDDGGNPFGIKAIEECVGEMSDGRPICYGIDLAKAVDYTVYVGLDPNGVVCRYGRWHKRSWDETMKLLIHEIGHTKSLVDQTGVGNPIVETMERVCQGVEGFTFSNTSKQQIMEGLALAIQKRQIRFPDNEIRQELETFEYDITERGRVRYAAPEGLHDDCVMALALAVEAWRTFVPVSIQTFAVGANPKPDPKLRRKDDEGVTEYYDRMRANHNWGFEKVRR